MTAKEFQDRLSAHAKASNLSLSTAARTELEAYFRLLSRWNAKINLTALPLQRPTAETFDRLLIEPLAAARYISNSANSWFDVGSGGGSPAIPLRIVQHRLELTMIESKTRKAAFLREAVRVLGLARVTVENDRFDNVAARTRPHTIDLVTVRAVKIDTAFFETLHRLLSPKGRAIFFHSQTTEISAPNSFLSVELANLSPVLKSRLSIFKPVFRNNIVD